MGAGGCGFLRSPCHAGMVRVEFYGGVSEPDSHIRDGYIPGPGQKQVDKAFLNSSHEMLFNIKEKNDPPFF
jgi:hypothetical protein